MYSFSQLVSKTDSLIVLFLMENSKKYFSMCNFFFDFLILRVDITWFFCYIEDKKNVVVVIYEYFLGVM